MHTTELAIAIALGYTHNRVSNSYIALGYPHNRVGNSYSARISSH